MPAGDDKEMSTYGLKELTPFEAVGQWKERVEREIRINKNHVAVKGDSAGNWPYPIKQKITGEKTPTYFTNEKEHSLSSAYEQTFHIQQGYNSKLHRDDRAHTVGLNINAEELGRPVPVLSSSSYGRRVHNPYEDVSTLRKHVRIELVMKGFYQHRGTGLPPVHN